MVTAAKHTANRKKGKEMRKRILTAAACVAFAIGVGQAQELKCTVEVNSSKIEGSSKSVFETLKQSLTDYMAIRERTMSSIPRCSSSRKGDSRGSRDSSRSRQECQRRY